MPTKHSSADIAAANAPQSMERVLNVIKTNKQNKNKKHPGKKLLNSDFQEFSRASAGISKRLLCILSAND